MINIIKANNIRKQAGYELCDPLPKALTAHVFISVRLQGGGLGVHLRAGSSMTVTFTCISSDHSDATSPLYMLIHVTGVNGAMPPQRNNFMTNIWAQIIKKWSHEVCNGAWDLSSGEQMINGV